MEDDQGHPIDCHDLSLEQVFSLRQSELLPGETNWVEYDGRVEDGPTITIGTRVCRLPAFGLYQLRLIASEVTSDPVTIRITEEPEAHPRVASQDPAWLLMAEMAQKARAIPFVRYQHTVTTTVRIDPQVGEGALPERTWTSTRTSSVRFGRPTSSTGRFDDMTVAALASGDPLADVPQSLQKVLWPYVLAHRRYAHRAAPSSWQTEEFRADASVKVLGTDTVGGQTTTKVGVDDGRAVQTVWYWDDNGLVLRRERTDTLEGMTVSTRIEASHVEFEPVGTEDDQTQATLANPTAVHTALFRAAEQEGIDMISAVVERRTKSSADRTVRFEPVATVELLAMPTQLPRFLAAAEHLSGCVAQPRPSRNRP